MGLFYFNDNSTVRLPEIKNLTAIIIIPKTREIKLTSHGKETIIIKGSLEKAQEIIRMYQIAKNQKGD